MTITFACGCKYTPIVREVERDFCPAHKNATLFARSLRRIAEHVPELIDKDTKRALNEWNEYRKEEPKP